jgi:hypothetical protein
MQPVSLWLTASVMAFGAVHLSAWNFTFPSPAERTLWRIGSIAMTVLPIFSLLNTSISITSSLMFEEVLSFKNSILSLWGDYYIAAGPKASSLPFLGPSPTLELSDLAISIIMEKDGDDQLAEFRRYIVEQNNSPAGQTRADNFEWFMTQIMAPAFISDLKYTDFTLYKTLTLVERLRGRNGTHLSFLEKSLCILAVHGFGRWIFLIASFLYIMFRLLIIVLSLISLRAMTDTVYDTTWAKNIPSVQ